MFFSNGFIFLLQIILSIKLNNLAVSFNYNSIYMPRCTTATAKCKMHVCTYDSRSWAPQICVKPNDHVM